MIADILRTATFRLAASFSLAFAAAVLSLFAFIYWETAITETRRIDSFMREQTRWLIRQTPEDALVAVNIGVSSDLHRMTYGALFTPDRQYLGGNLDALPPGLTLNGVPHQVRVPDGDRIGEVRAMGRRAPDGRIVVVGRNVDQLVSLHRLVRRALLLGLIPTVALALLVGVLLSVRTVARLRTLHVAIERIMAGDLHERLPLRGTRDDLDLLTASVNRMLTEIERLVAELQQVGNSIAHDLRTPLARLRARLDRARSGGDLGIAVDGAIGDLDQMFALVAALLRIAEIESGRRRAAFGPVALSEILEEVAEMYRPMAEERGQNLAVQAGPALSVQGDRDLLMELVANLVDNALKFAPDGGSVTLACEQRGAPWIWVADDGPGIPEAQRQDIFKRFYRADRSRHIQGSGLGLSIAAAIVRLHGFHIAVQDNHPGARFAVRCAA